MNIRVQCDGVHDALFTSHISMLALFKLRAHSCVSNKWLIFTPFATFSLADCSAEASVASLTTMSSYSSRFVAISEGSIHDMNADDTRLGRRVPGSVTTGTPHLSGG